MDTNKYGSDVVEIDLMEVAGLLWHRIWLILLCALFAGAAGFVLSRFVVTEQYQSTTKVYVLNRQNDNTLTYSDVQLGTQLTKDFPELIKSRYVSERVITEWELPYRYEDFVKKISVVTQTDTRIISITVTDEDPQMAQHLANEVRKVAAERIKSVMEIQAVNVVDEANLPDHPASPSVGRWTIIGTLIGAFLCIAVILLHFMLDDTIKTADDIEKYLGLSTLGMIPEREDPEKSHRGAGHTAHSREESGHGLYKKENGSFADAVIKRAASKKNAERMAEEEPAAGKADEEKAAHGKAAENTAAEKMAAKVTAMKRAAAEKAVVKRTDTAGIRVGAADNADAADMEDADIEEIDLEEAGTPDRAGTADRRLGQTTGVRKTGSRAVKAEG